VWELNDDDDDDDNVWLVWTQVSCIQVQPRVQRQRWRAVLPVNTLRLRKKHGHRLSGCTVDSCRTNDCVGLFDSWYLLNQCCVGCHFFTIHVVLCLDKHNELREGNSDLLTLQSYPLFASLTVIFLRTFSVDVACGLFHCSSNCLSLVKKPRRF